MQKKFRPVTPGTRWLSLERKSKDNSLNKDGEKYTVCKKLTFSKKSTGGRNNLGRITCRHRGGGHKKHYRIVDFLRNKDEIVGVVDSIQYDPNRSADIALIVYPDGEKRYILAPQELKIKDKVVSGDEVECEPGNCMKLKNIPSGLMVHCVELVPARGAALARSAGTSAQVAGFSGKYCVLKLPSGERRLINSECRATIGFVSNKGHFLRSEGKAGRKRYMGIRPTVRGTAMNPVDHPRGGGEGRQNGYLAYSFSGKESKGSRTRSKRKPSSSFILAARKSRKNK